MDKDQGRRSSYSYKVRVEVMVQTEGWTGSRVLYDRQTSRATSRYMGSNHRLGKVADRQGRITGNRGQPGEVTSIEGVSIWKTGPGSNARDHQEPFDQELLKYTEHAFELALLWYLRCNGDSGVPTGGGVVRPELGGSQTGTTSGGQVDAAYSTVLRREHWPLEMSHTAAGSAH